jgi:hypothetical protein
MQASQLLARFRWPTLSDPRQRFANAFWAGFLLLVASMWLSLLFLRGQVPAATPIVLAFAASVWGWRTAAVSYLIAWSLVRVPLAIGPVSSLFLGVMASGGPASAPSVVLPTIATIAASLLFWPGLLFTMLVGASFN